MMSRGDSASCPAVRAEFSGGEGMSEWISCKLGGIADVQTGPFGSQLHREDYKLVGTPIITVEHLGDNRITYQNLPLVSDEDKERLSKYLLIEGDIVFSRVGSVDRRAYVSKNENGWLFSGRLLRVRANQEVMNPKFLSYYFGDESFKEYIRRIAVGATMPSINTTILSEVGITYPPLPEQKAIASVLSSLDDKIDLLHRQNKTLEAIAETLFRQWFIEEAQDDWEVGALKAYLDIGIGRTPPRKEHQWFSENPKDLKWISIKDLGNDGAYIFNTAEYLTQDAVEQFNIPLIPENTALLSFKMTVGRVAITTEQMLSNEAIAHFKFRLDTPFTVEYLYLHLKNYQYDLLGSTSSIVTSINSAMIKDMEIIIPSKESMERFNDIIRGLFEKIRGNQQQIQTLEKLRDTLLPKLMSGEVRVAL